MKMKQSGYGIAGMILGIIGLATSFSGAGIAFAIAGIVLSGKGFSRKDRAQGVSIAGLCCSIPATVLSVFVILFMGSDGGDQNFSNRNTEQVNAYVEENEMIDSEEEEKKEGEDSKAKSGKESENKNIFSEELAKYENEDYPYITKKDMSKYHANMVGVQFCMIIEIDDFEDNAIQSTINEGYMMSNFNTIKDYSNILEEGDKVAIVGKVDGYDSYSFVGKSISFSECMVIAKGEDVEEYRKKKSDKSLKKYFEVTEEVANSGAEITEEEYKNLCESLDYEKILRNPDDCDGKRCKVSGTVYQIIEGFFGSFTIYLKDSSGNIWGCTYSYKDGEEHVLENDSITIYGECKGTDNASTVLGKQVTMPKISVEYIN